MKQKYILTAIFFQLFIGSLFAQDPPQMKERFVMTSDFVDPYDLASKNWVSKNTGDITYHSFDALHYSLQLDWFENYSAPYSHFYLASETFRFLVDSTLNSIQLNASDSSIRIDSVGMAATSFLQYNDLLTLSLNGIYQPGDTVTVKIYFTHKNYIDQAFRVNGGFVFTDCSPEKAHFWFPCWDRPFDKATFEVNVKTKIGTNLCSNGALIDTLVIGDSLWVHWKSAHPLSTYIMANVSKRSFNVIEDYWHKPTNPLDSIPVLYYYNNGDVVDSLRFHMMDMLDYFSSIYGEYPFEKLGWATLNADFPWSGMENQTIISLYPNGWDDKTTTSHEFAHHWFGDLITHATWADIFVKEGFPTFSSALWYQHLYGRAGYISKMMEYNTYYLQNNPQWPIYNPSWATVTPAANILFNYAITYCKSACIIHSLKGIVGDTAFFNILKSYTTDTNLMFKTATIQDFINKTNLTTGSDYTWFFDQWLSNANHPIYNNNTVISNFGADWVVDYTISQTQTDAPFFKMPVDVQVIFTDRTDTIFRIMNDVNNQTYSFTLPKQPNTIVFDPFVKILPKVETAVSKCAGMKTLTAMSDTIEDGSGTGNYGNNSSCYWNISPSNNPSTILLHFLDFDTEEDSDTLIISNSDVSPIQPLAILSGRYVPADIICNTNRVRLKFSTNKYVTHQGWNVSYTTSSDVANWGNILSYSIYPNPATDAIYLMLTLESMDDVIIKITNLLGQIVYSETQKNIHSLNKKLEVSTLRAGTYIIEIQTNKGTIQHKMVKRN